MALARKTIPAGIAIMSNDALVRPVTQKDYEQWLPLWDGYNAVDGRSDITTLPDGVRR